MQKERFDESQLVLSCWKEIAQYLGKGVRTVQRWEQDLDLPVRRPNSGSVKGPVAARPADLDNWIANRWTEGSLLKRRRPAFSAFEQRTPMQRLLHPPQLKAQCRAQILTSKKLRSRNRALMGDLARTLENLRIVCGNLEAEMARGAETEALLQGRRTSAPAFQEKSQHPSVTTFA